MPRLINHALEQHQKRYPIHCIHCSGEIGTLKQEEFEALEHLDIPDSESLSCEDAVVYKRSLNETNRVRLIKGPNASFSLESGEYRSAIIDADGNIFAGPIQVEDTGDESSQESFESSGEDTHSTKYSQEDEDFERCVAQGGEVRRVSGPDEKHGLEEGEYVNYCFWPDGSGSVRGEVKKKKSFSESDADEQDPDVDSMSGAKTDYG